MIDRRRHVGAQRGATMLVVLVLLSVMLLGAGALARMTEIGTLASGNLAYREASLQASEVGLNTAYESVKALVATDTTVANTYYATAQTTDANGIPAVAFDSAPSVTVNGYEVRYVSERMCTATPVTDTFSQCLLKQKPLAGSHKATDDEIDPPNSVQYRVTIRVTGPKGTTTWVQSLVTKG